MFNRAGVEARVAAIREELQSLADARKKDTEQAAEEKRIAAERQRINTEYKESLESVTNTYEGQAEMAEMVLAKETAELETARRRQLSIEQEFANLRKEITAPDAADVSGLDVQTELLKARTKLAAGDAKGAIDSARDAGELLKTLKDDGDEAGFVLSFLAKEIERVANQAAQQTVDVELIDEQKAQQAAQTLRAQLQSLTEEAPQLGAEAGTAYIQAFQQALNQTIPQLPTPAQPEPRPVSPIRRSGNSFGDGTSFQEPIERSGGK